MKTQGNRQNRVMDTARNIFLQQVERKLGEAQQALSTLQVQGYDPQTCQTLYRIAHTFKGSGQMVGLRDIAEPALEITTALSLVENYKVELGPGLQAFLAERLDDIIDEVARLRDESSAHTGEEPTAMVCTSKKVLVVDDDPTITKLVQERLEQEGLAVAVCHNTVEAEKHLQVEQPDLILLDILMPGENGIEFCRRIRSKESHRIIPIIFFTVKGELQDKLVGFATGADDYLAKPFEMEELVARINTILSRVETFRNWAWQDELTTAYNRRYLQHRLQKELSRNQACGGNFSLAMIDLNLFKTINDTYGHSMGDEALKSLVARMKQVLSANDVVCRYGGDEFVVIFPNSNHLLVSLALERLCHEVEANPFVLSNSETIGLTLSVGVATFPGDGRTCEELLAVADAAMYRAKQAGGNKILFSEGGLM